MAIEKVKLDQYLVQQSLAQTHEEARGLILAGQVVVDDQRQDKVGYLVSPGQQVRVKNQRKFVGRGGNKLEGALDFYGLTTWIAEKSVLDLGASTGGFTDACLKAGAGKVVTVDIGTNQLAWTLRQDPRVECFEKTDLRDFKPRHDMTFDLVVGDLSFISLGAILPHILKLAPHPNTRFLLLVKPQFELPPQDIPQGGVVVSDADRQRCVREVSEKMASAGLMVSQPFNSLVKGRDGNQETFLLSERL